MSEQRLHCQRCGEPLQDDDLFCPECGAPAPKPEPQPTTANACPNCGAPAVPGDAFCGECGHTISAPQQPPPPPAGSAHTTPAGALPALEPDPLIADFPRERRSRTGLFAILGLGLLCLVIVAGLVFTARLLLDELDSSDGTTARATASTGQATTTPAAVAGASTPSATTRDAASGAASPTSESISRAEAASATAADAGAGDSMATPSSAPIVLTVVPPATQTPEDEGDGDATPQIGATEDGPDQTSTPTPTRPAPTATSTSSATPTATATSPPPPTATPTATSPPPATATATATTIIIDVEADVTDTGTVSASSVYSSQFPVSLAIDKNLATSWFSAGPEPGGGATVFRWDSPTDILITGIDILSNSENSVADFRTGFGFSAVTIQILNGSGGIVYEQAYALDGTPDPDVYDYPEVTGRSVVLLLSGHEDPTCGGFAEFTVWSPG